MITQELMAKEIDKLKAETANLKAQLQAATAKSPAAAAATTTTAAASKQVLPRDPEEDQKILDIIKEKDTENQKTGFKTKKGPKKVAVKAAEPEELFFGEPVEAKASKKTAAKKTATKKAAKKATKKAATKTAPKSDDWSALSLSTLKRKTVKDLSEYLSQKGVEVTHGDGTPMKKEELVSAVQSLQEA
jgi:hypothetical protein